MEKFYLDQANLNSSSFILSLTGLETGHTAIGEGKSSKTKELGFLFCFVEQLLKHPTKENFYEFLIICILLCFFKQLMKKEK